MAFCIVQFFSFIYQFLPLFYLFGIFFWLSYFNFFFFLWIYLYSGCFKVFLFLCFCHVWCCLVWSWLVTHFPTTWEAFYRWLLDMSIVKVKGLMTLTNLIYFASDNKTTLLIILLQHFLGLTDILFFLFGFALALIVSCQHWKKKHWL